MIAVLTTIQSPTRCVRRLLESLRPSQTPLIVIGDRKGPKEFPVEGVQFHALEDQLSSTFELARTLPVGHYARKNVGYLEAVRQGAECIYETDDDNMPNDSWQPRSIGTEAQKVAPRQWMNVYRVFSEENIWPRGFPLDAITDRATYAHDGAAPIEKVEAPIQQGLADLAPDVDAVWRLALDREFYFHGGPSLWRPAGTWCPFNSQTTWFWPVAYPLLYLPSYCSFRMTDIWRSFVAQRCLWEMGKGLVFHAPEAIQERNVHNLMRDFEDEIPGYMHNRKIVEALENTSLESGDGAVGRNLRTCYGSLVKLGVIPEKEMALVDAWLKDLAGLQPVV